MMIRISYLFQDDKTFVIASDCKERSNHKIKYGLRIASLALAMTAVFTVSAFALEVPDGVKDYYKDNVSSSPGISEGVGPTEKAKRQEGVDIGRREETKQYDFSDESSLTLAAKAWEALNKKDEDSVLAYTERCIELYEQKARDQEASLDDFAPSGSEKAYDYLNSLSACYFIRGELYKNNKDWKKAKENYQTVIDRYYFGQYWDPRGWWWKPSQIAKDEIKKIDAGYYENK